METPNTHSQNQTEALQQNLAVGSRILAGLDNWIVGQRVLKERLLIGLLCNGHILLEGVPGLAKTLAIKVLAQLIDASFHRIQFTPDLLPSDLIGTEIYRPHTGNFEVRQGPIFANFILADEINRAPAKVQSALLEIMQERQVTIGDTTFVVPRPFFVMATQNPVEQEGTYPLPEAQVDRFLMKLTVSYPSQDEEREMLRRQQHSGQHGSFMLPELKPVATLAEIEQMQRHLALIHVDEKIYDYVVRLVRATRSPATYITRKPEEISRLIELGASPRATLALARAAQADAFINAQPFVTPQHVKNVAADVLRHRLILSYEADVQGLSADDVVSMILGAVDVP